MTIVYTSVYCNLLTTVLTNSFQTPPAKDNKRKRILNKNIKNKAQRKLFTDVDDILPISSEDDEEAAGCSKIVSTKNVLCILRILLLLYIFFIFSLNFSYTIY